MRRGGGSPEPLTSRGKRDPLCCRPVLPLSSLNLLGPAAGLLTSVLWTLTSILFAAAGRRLGSTVVNATRIALAIVILGLIHRFIISDDGAWIPQMRGGQVLLLALSGVIGLSLGDQALFTAFVDIGPRLSNLLMTTSPLFATVFAWVPRPLWKPHWVSSAQ